MPVGEAQYNVWRQNRSQKKGGGVMVLTRRDVIIGKVEKGEDMALFLSSFCVIDRVGNEKWKKKRLGSHISSTQDQCLGERRVWRHNERHM